MNYTDFVILSSGILGIIQATNLFFPTAVQLHIARVLFVVWIMILCLAIIYVE